MSKMSQYDEPIFYTLMVLSLAGKKLGLIDEYKNHADSTNKERREYIEELSKTINDNINIDHSEVNNVFRNMIVYSKVRGNRIVIDFPSLYDEYVKLS